MSVPTNKNIAAEIAPYISSTFIEPQLGEILFMFL